MANLLCIHAHPVGIQGDVSQRVVNYPEQSNKILTYEDRLSGSLASGGIPSGPWWASGIMPGLECPQNSGEYGTYTCSESRDFRVSDHISIFVY